VYFVDNIGDQVLEQAGQGIDTVYATANWTMAADQEIETLRAYGVGAAAGTKQRREELKNNLIGGLGNDTLDGGGGNDRLQGGAGNDVMTGGASNDVYYVDSVGDQVLEQVGEGSDIVYATTSWAMAADQEIEYLKAYGAGAAS